MHVIRKLIPITEHKRCRPPTRPESCSSGMKTSHRARLAWRANAGERSTIPIASWLVGNQCCQQTTVQGGQPLFRALFSPVYQDVKSLAWRPQDAVDAGLGRGSVYYIQSAATCKCPASQVDARDHGGAVPPPTNGPARAFRGSGPITAVGDARAIAFDHSRPPQSTANVERLSAG